jgi:hypothetical protein
MPSTISKLAIFERIKRVSSTMGISVINGAMAIFRPSLLLCLRVSEMTRVNRGPGDIPAVSPKTAPIVRYVIVCGIIPYVLLWVLDSLYIR